jgi:hypothetical protein
MGWGFAPGGDGVMGVSVRVGVRVGIGVLGVIVGIGVLGVGDGLVVGLSVRVGVGVGVYVGEGTSATSAG